MAKLTRLQVAAAIAGIVGTGVAVLGYLRYSHPTVTAGPGGIAVGRDVTIGPITQYLPVPAETKPKPTLDEQSPQPTPIEIAKARAYVADLKSM